MHGEQNTMLSSKANKKMLVGFFGTFLGAGRDMPMTPIDRWALSE
jgi:hypothetical protein